MTRHARFGHIPLLVLTIAGGAAMAQPVHVRPVPWFDPTGQTGAPFHTIRGGICGSFQSPIDLRLAPGTYFEQPTLSAPGTYTTTSGTATIDATASAVTTFRIVSYNVRLWPGFFVSLTLADQERAEWIGPRLATEQADVCVIQESWDYRLDSVDASARNNALRGNYYWNQYYGSTFFSGDNVNSGLLTQSVHALTGGTQVRYTECDGDDCQASKGFTRVLLTKNGFNIAVYNTHAQAGDSSGNVSTRYSQINELAANILLFRALNPSYAVFVGGDFNVHGGASEFTDTMSAVMGGVAGLAHGALNEQCSPQTTACTACSFNTIKQIFGGGSSTRLDHILYAGSLDGTVKVIPTNYEVKRYRRTDGGQWCRTVTPTGCADDFSDHEPVLMNFELRRVTP